MRWPWSRSIEEGGNGVDVDDSDELATEMKEAVRRHDLLVVELQRRLDRMEATK